MRSDMTRRRDWRWRERVGRDGDPDLFGMANEDEARHLLEPPWEREMADGAARPDYMLCDVFQRLSASVTPSSSSRAQKISQPFHRAV
jgi:hypothetical protein